MAMGTGALCHPTAVSSGGTGEAARFVAKQLGKSLRQLQNVYVLGQQAKGSLNALYQVFAECCSENWDGYGAAPISVDLYLFAGKVLEALPLGTPAPSIGAEPDGHITLEWHSSLRHTLSVSVSPEGDLHYAALRGASKVYGTEPFYGAAPKAIVDLIHQISAA